MQNEVRNFQENDQPRNQAPSNSILINKTQLKQKIKSRNDFIIIFGFQRFLISSVFSSTKTIHYVAFYRESPFW